MHAILNILVLLQSLVTRWAESTHTRQTRSRAVGSKSTKPPATLCKNYRRLAAGDYAAGLLLRSSSSCQ